MVELCELHIIPDDDQWPDDIDSRIAALNFGGDSVLFESLIDADDDDDDANIVSTDSLDSQKFRELSQVKKDDFQLAFADSGHWQSGILTEPGGITTQLTTWGRIRTSEPLDERTASAPNVVFGGTTGRHLTHTNSRRPNSLIANFVDTTKYVDLNDNEIREIDEQHVEVLRKDRWRRELKTAEIAAAAVPKRTFADILNKTKNQRAPKLEFLAMHHEMPSLCESFTASFRDVILKTQKEAVSTTLTDFPLNYYCHEDDSPDSGLGCSNNGGPSHIEDWQSLCVLLPKHVAEACSFFKSNTQLLMSNNTSSSRKASPRTPPQNLCIDHSARRVGISASANEACRTCYRVKRRIHPPIWAQTANSKQVLCDCAATTTPTDTQFSFAPTTSTTRHQLRARELSIVGLPIYSQKRCLVENVVEGVAAISRGEGCEDLVVAMRALIEDGLLEGISPWNMIKTVTSKGPATKDVHSIVRQLEECQKSDAAKVEIFFEELIRENSLDCWLCYIVLKEKTLKKLYHVDSFLVSASAEYRTLLWRMVDSLSLLAVIEARTSTSSTTSSAVWQRWGGASRIAADSRVPKSSSVPARLATATSRRQQPSRIPLSTSRTSFTSTSSTPRTLSRTFRIATVIADYSIEQFHVSRGEKLRVLSTRHGMARVFRLATDDVAKLRNGLIPVENLSTSL